MLSTEQNPCIGVTRKRKINKRWNDCLVVCEAIGRCQCFFKQQLHAPLHCAWIREIFFWQATMNKFYEKGCSTQCKCWLGKRSLTHFFLVLVFFVFFILIKIVFFLFCLFLSLIIIISHPVVYRVYSRELVKILDVSFDFLMVMKL